MDLEVTVDLEEVKQFIESDKFAQFLLTNTTQFSSAAFILQALFNAVDNAAQSIDNLN